MSKKVQNGHKGEACESAPRECAKLPYHVAIEGVVEYPLVVIVLVETEVTVPKLVPSSLYTIYPAPNSGAPLKVIVVEPLLDDTVLADTLAKASCEE